MREIAEHIIHVLNDGTDSVLVTVMKHRGSAPRHAGSQMLVDGSGLACGTIGGGAIEGHAIAEAQAMLGERHGQVEDLALKLQGKNSLGMACGGDAVLLYTPVVAGDEQWGQVARGLVRCFEERVPAYLALACCEEAPAFESSIALLDEAGACMAGCCNVSKEQFGSLKLKGICNGCYLMPIPLPTRAIVFGGGHVGRATVAALSRVGFDCTLFECRPDFARPEDVPAAKSIVLGSYENIAASLSLDAHDYALIMTNTHRYDYAVLSQVLRQPLAYVGMIGSRKKIALGRKLMLEEGISEEALDAVHMPIGLDIKAETPEEIAVSIAAECILHRATN